MATADCTVLQNVNTDDLPFPTTKRVSVDALVAPEDCLILSVATHFDMDSNSLVDLDGKEQDIAIASGKRIAVHALGFLGPMSSDASYKVSVRIKRHTYPNVTEVLGQVSKQISAAKNKQFYFFFDEPIILDPLPINHCWNDYYYIYYTLTAEGQNVAPQGLNTVGDGYEVQVGNTEFVFCTAGKQLMEILFKNV